MEQNRRPSPLSLDARRRRLLFRATHRGMKETEQLFGGFVAAEIATLSETDLDALEAALALPDPDLVDWLMGRRPIPAACDAPVLRKMEAEIRRRMGEP
jgi:antitoxin CptB